MSWCATAVFVSVDISCWISAQLESRNGNHLFVGHSCRSLMRSHFRPATWLPWAAGLSCLFMKLSVLNSFTLLKFPILYASCSHQTFSSFLPKRAKRRSVAHMQNMNICHFNKDVVNKKKKRSYINYNSFFFKRQALEGVHSKIGKQILSCASQNRPIENINIQKLLIWTNTKQMESNEWASINNCCSTQI